MSAAYSACHRRRLIADQRAQCCGVLLESTIHVLERERGGERNYHFIVIGRMAALAGARSIVFQYFVYAFNYCNYIIVADYFFFLLSHGSSALEREQVNPISVDWGKRML